MVPDLTQQNTLPENFNMDFSQRVVIFTESLNWLPSPAPGVKRKPLEREQRESGHTTSIVKYAPDTSFSSHSHPLGEEIFVLDGVFSDESGDYPAGSYIRNPPGSRHAPFSTDGCTLFVKLNQFDPQDSEQIRTQAAPFDDLGAAVPQEQRLHHFSTSCGDYSESTCLQDYPASDSPQIINAEDGVEILVIKGLIGDDQTHYPAGTWLRIPDQSPGFQVYQPTRLLVKRGQLQRHKD